MPVRKPLMMLDFAGPIARYTLLEAARNRLLWLLAVALVASLAMAGFLQQVALTEAAQIQTAVTAAFMRLFAVFLVASFVVTSMVREFNDKVLEFVLAKPLDRASYLFGKLAGFLAVSAAIAIAVSLPLALFTPLARIPAWTLSLFCELAIVTAAALFCVFTLNQVVTALAAVLGFYVLARAIAAIQIIAGAAAGQASWSDRLSSGIVAMIAALLPSLDRMTQAAWLLDTAPDWSTLGVILGQTAVYVAVLVSAALFDLYRQNF